MDRRSFSKQLAWGAVAWVAGGSPNTAEAQEQNPTLYYADGYHGGVAGHMPAGAWRDVFNALRDLPKWKLSLDIEPESWDVLRRTDPQAYRELKAHLDQHGPNARVEMVGCTYSQPYGWAIGGESNVRQLVRGCEVIREHFPNAVLVTYAVQEPCWASCLPQILKSLGFTGAVLRDASTAWGGYPAGFDAEVVNWAGPDGTLLPMVPRYACEAVQKVYETESISGSVAFAKKSIEHGIAKPVGMCFQDLGWPAKPRVSADYIRYVTWSEYIHSIASKPEKQWAFGIEDTLCSLPWGEHILQGVAQQVRSAENKILMAEKLATLAYLHARSAWPAEQFREAWDDLLLTQAHDAWITATTRFGRQAWAFQVASDTLTTENKATAILDNAAEALSQSASAAPSTPLGPQSLRVFNTLGIERNDLAEFALATDPGTEGIQILDQASNEVPCQVIPTRRYLSPELRNDLSRRREIFAEGQRGRESSGSINTATVLFRPTVPPIGYATYQVVPLYKKAALSQGTTSGKTDTDGSVVLESDLYRIRLDPKRGGVFTSLYAKQLNREFCDASAQRLFNEYRGYFIAQKKWCSSADEKAQITIQENGPLRTRVRISGHVGGCPVQTTITLVEGQRRIDLQTRIVFEQDTWIGDPWDMKPEDRRSEQRRSSNDGRWKLQAHFPAALKNQAIYKNAAYDVCKSRNQDTFFQRWDEIKHNIVTNWVDVFDEQEKYGLTVFSDHTTAYTHGPEFPLSLVLAWGWEGGFWWGKRPLNGVQQVNYAVMLHKGAWDEAEVSKENAVFCEPLMSRLLPGPSETKGTQKEATNVSFVQVSGNGIEIPTMLVSGSSVDVRLFNAEGDTAERHISFLKRPARVELIELHGKVIQRMQVEDLAGRFGVKLAIPRFGLRTLRCQFEDKSVG